MQTTGRVGVMATKEMLLNVFRNHTDMFKSKDKAALDVYAMTVISALQKQAQEASQ